MNLDFEIEETIEVIDCSDCDNDFLNCITLDLDLCNGNMVEAENE